MGNGPVHWNFHHFADRIVNQRRLCFCVIVGDSTCAMNQGASSGVSTGEGRWACGWIRNGDVNWAQIVTWDHSTAGGEGQSSIGISSTSINYGATLGDAATTNPFPLAIAENSITGTGAHSHNMGRRIIQLTTAAYKGGDWTAGQTIKISWYNTKATDNWAAACPSFQANGSGDSVAQTHSQALWGSTNGAANTFAYPDWARNSSSATDITIQTINHAAGGPNTCNFYKTRVKVHNTTTGLGVTKGFGWASLSQGGWNTRHHLDTYSQASLNAEVLAMGYNVAIIQLGINVATGESSSNLATTVYRDNLRSVVEKYQAALVASGVADPMVLIQNPWTAGGSPGSGYINSQNEWALQIAKQCNSARCPVAFLSIERLVRKNDTSGDGWYDSGAGSGVTYLADGTHQKAAGVSTWVTWIQNEAKAAVATPGIASRSRNTRGRGNRATAA